MKKIIRLVLVLGILVSVFGCAEVKQKDDIYIFFTSDVHCGVEDNMTMAGVKSLVDGVKLEHEYVSLVDCGDFLQGGALGSLSKGKFIIDIMNAIGYDIATVGNHEFDYGMDVLKERMAESNFDYVVSNIKYSGNKKNVFANTAEYIIKDYGGTKVAFIGVATPYSITDSTPKNFMEGSDYVYNFYSGDDGNELYERVQSVVDEVRKQRVKYVIALTHLGSEEQYAPFDSISLISHTSGIDVVLDGHSHSVIVEDKYPNKNGEDVTLSSVGTKLQSVGELILAKDGSIYTLHIDSHNEQDEEVIKVVDNAKTEVDKILSESICNLDYDMKIYDEEGIRIVRTRESTVGDFVTDAYRTILGTDIAIVNGGGVRSDIIAGEVTYRSLFDVTPFQNNGGSCYATGQQIMDALEYGARYTSGIYKLDGNAVGEFGGFLQVSGLKYTIDTSIESSVMVDDDGMFTGFANDDRKVKDVYVLQNDEYVPIDPEKTYSVGGISYMLFDGGDGNTIFMNCEKISDNDHVDIEILKQYLNESGGFNDTYRETQGRIIIE